MLKSFLQSVVFAGAACAVAVSTPLASGQQNDFSVNITIDAAKTKGELKPIYRFFGADEPNYATMKDGLKLLGDIGKLGSGPGVLPHAQPHVHGGWDPGFEVGIDQHVHRGCPGQSGL